MNFELYNTMDISVVIPLYNEDESLPELYAWIERVMAQNNFSFEVIFVNDGSTDRSWEVITELSEKSEHVKGIKFRRNYGKSPALYCGFKEAQGDVVITMDADLQDSPDEIPELYRMIKEDGYDLVSGYKQNRSQGDPLSKTIPTKLFNATTRKVSGIKNLHDFNCGLKAYRQEVVKNIEVFGEMHRFIPYLAKNAGVVGVLVADLHGVVVDVRHGQFVAHVRHVHGLELQIGHRTRRVLREGLVDSQADVGALYHFALDEVSLNDFFSYSITHLQKLLRLN